MSCFLLLLCCFCCCAVVVCFAAVAQQKKNLSSHFRLDANFFFNVNFLFLDFRSSILFFHSLLFAVTKQLVRWESCMLSQEQDKTRRECRRRDLSFLSSLFHAVLSSAGPKWEEVLGFSCLVKVMPSLTMSFFAPFPAGPIVKPIFQFFF